MNNSESGNSGKMIGAFLIGAAIGAAIGVLMAPGKGSETRKKMFEGAKDLADDLTGKFKKTMKDMKGFENPDEERPI